MSKKQLHTPSTGMRIRLVHRDGQEYFFPSPLALSQWLSSRISKKRAAQKRWDLNIGFPDHGDCFRWILRDDNGDSVSPADLPLTKEAIRWKKRNVTPDNAWREEPVAGTGIRHWGGWRHPKTQNQRRMAYKPVDEHEPFPRKQPSKFVTAWDDIQKSRSRCWKRYRKTQWKDKKGLDISSPEVAY